MGFDIEEYTRTAGAVNFEDLDYAAFRTRPLSSDALRSLRYMCDIESHTVCYLRDLLVTPSHADPEVTAFLTMWAFEEYWYGEALAKVLDAHGIGTGHDHIRGVRARLARSGRARRLTRFALRRFWEPVGSGVMPAAETRHLVRFLMGGEAGARSVARIDDKIDRLPGLSGLRLVGRAVERLANTPA